ncbi:MAG: hypothetical protein JWP29_2221 [Rhodoferax sp.]|nr:hypothetical protein [Rhodoferax sp.]
MCAVLERHPGVEAARIYGSRANGSYRPGSDIDSTLFGSRLTSGDLLWIEVEIEALGLPYQVDLSLYDQIDDPAVRDYIERIGQVFFKAVGP